MRCCSGRRGRAAQARGPGYRAGLDRDRDGWACE
ncbi:excalibur calcium-binding domain-containing protein [Lawsonella clevelandensis]|nr:excalibur calcium-binding domain-containing protein [Lawsonella clevelandensis]